MINPNDAPKGYIAVEDDENTEVCLDCAFYDEPKCPKNPKTRRCWCRPDLRPDKANVHFIPEPKKPTKHEPQVDLQAALDQGTRALAEARGAYDELYDTEASLRNAVTQVQRALKTLKALQK